MPNLILKKESYSLLGVLFDVHKLLKLGLAEIIYRFIYCLNKKYNN